MSKPDELPSIVNPSLHTCLSKLLLENGIFMESTKMALATPATGGNVLKTISPFLKNTSERSLHTAAMNSDSTTADRPDSSDIAAVQANCDYRALRRLVSLVAVGQSRPPPRSVRRPVCRYRCGNCDPSISHLVHELVSVGIRVADGGGREINRHVLVLH